MSFYYHTELPLPSDFKETYPLSEKMKEAKCRRDREISDIFTGKSHRFLVIIGPCSADREDAVCEYVCRLAKISEKTKDRLLIIPRIYTSKPRTTGTGYKGMLHQPNPLLSPDLAKGLVAVRKLHLRAFYESGLSAADELLYPEIRSYLDDLLSYEAVGARSVENQQHRLTASGMDIPVGMKNPTSGDLSVMMNSITAAQGSHTFIYRNWEVVSRGNPYAHAILRGHTNKRGQSIPNYHYEDLKIVCDMYNKEGLANPAVIVDVNHANSGKKYMEQIRIAKEVLQSKSLSEDINKIVKGLMIESYIEDGSQPIDGCVYGQSITDPCLGWEKSERLICEIAEMV